MQMKNLLTQIARVTGVVAVTLSMSLAAVTTANATEKKSCETKDKASYCASKQVDKSTAKRGDTLTYTLSLTNNGNVELNDVLFYDRIPTHTTYVANSAVITKGNQSKQPSENWVNTGINFGKVEVGQTVKLVFKVKVNNDVAHGTDIQNVGQFKTNELPNWVQCAVHTIVKVDHKPTPTPSSTPTPTPTPTPTGEVLGATPTPTVPPVAELPSTGPGLALVASLGGIVSALWGRKYFLSR